MSVSLSSRVMAWMRSASDVGMGFSSITQPSIVAIRAIPHRKVGAILPEVI